jgi:glycosyltransferase involved in cell wall biosynthesis
MTETQQKIAIVSQYFFPDHASTGTLMTNLALGLLNKGCDVKVYTGYPSYWGIKQQTKKIENYNGLLINRISHLRLDTRTKTGSILIGLSFFFCVLFKLIFSSEKRIYFFVTTPPFLPFVGYMLKKIRNQRYIVIVYDIHPDITIKINYTKEGFVTKIWERLNRLIYNNADKIIVLGECMAEVMRRKIPDNAEKIAIIQNWEDETFIKPMSKSENWFSNENGLLEKFVVVYSGNMGVNHNLEIIIKAASHMNDMNINFIFFGEGSQKSSLMKKSNELHLKNVQFFDFQPLKNLPYTMTCGDAIIVSQEKGTESLCVSCKFYTALAAGKPIIAIIGENSEISRVIKKYNCGIVISNYEDRLLAEKITELSSDKRLCQKLGENARSAFERYFTYQIAMTKYFEIVKEIDGIQN